MTVQETIAIAMGQYQSGQFQQAEEIARQILSQEPNQPDMLHLMGVVRHRAGDLANAIACYASAAQQQPQNPQLLNNFGVALRDSGRLNDAAAAFARAMQLDSQSPAAQNLAALLHQAGQFEQAIPVYQHVLQQRPDQPDIINSMGNAYAQNGKLESALQCYEKALALRPNYPEAHLNIGNVLNLLGQRERAIESFQRAIELRPDYAEAHRALGNVLRGLDRVDEAVAEQRRSVELNPQSPLAIRDLGNSLLAAGQFDAATEAFKNVLTVDPNDAAASMAIGMTLLLHGDFENGLPLYEQRWRLPEHGRFEQNFGKAQWDGGDLSGKRILLHAEQGLGDTIQFMRYVPQVIERGGRVFFACLPEMTRLLKQFSGIERFFTSGDALPDFDLHCSLATLPLVLKTTMSTIPADVPSVSAEADLSAKWKQRLATGHRKNVGLIWAGRPNPDPKRTIPLEKFSALAKCRNVQFFSLQVGAAAKEIASIEHGLSITDLSNDLTDLIETAAAMANLDLIITIDTAGAHLAGALARPVWTLLPFLPDWRWFLNRSDSPWYPTMRLFRQPSPGDWKSPIEQIADALDEFAKP